MSKWIIAGKADEIPPGGWKILDTDTAEVVIFNHGGTFYAIENVCTHDGGPLAGGDIEGDEVICPRHEAHFSIKTGEALTPPAYEPVDTYQVQVIDGMVQVNIEKPV